MKIRVSHRVPVFPHFAHANYLHNQRRSVSSFIKHLRAATKARASFNGGSGSSQGQSFTSVIHQTSSLELTIPEKAKDLAFFRHWSSFNCWRILICFFFIMNVFSFLMVFFCFIYVLDYFYCVPLYEEEQRKIFL